MRILSRTFPGKQHGVVLIIALVLLFTLTLIAVGSMGTSRLEQKMTANMRDRQVAFQAAEAALRDGERFVQDNALIEANFDATCTGGQCLCTSTMAGGCIIEYWTDTGLSVWTTAGLHKEYQGTQIGSQTAKYIIEYLGQTCDATAFTAGGCLATDPVMYRITAIGFGQTVDARVMLQSTYMKN